jgi:hypothetical protein
MSTSTNHDIIWMCLLDIIPHLEETVLKNQYYGVYTGYTYLYKINYYICCYHLTLRLS